MKRYAKFAAITLALALSGCIDFEKQTIVVVTAPEKDELHVLLVYEGLHVSGGRQRAEEQLQKFVESQQEFCITDNWLGRVDLAPSKDGKEDTENPRRANRLRALTRSHFAISNGTFFINPDGQLSGWQQIAVRNASQYVAGVNGLLAEAFAEMAAAGLRGPK
jgi:hypothetical protein